MQAAGIQKVNSFNTVLRLLAARTGSLLNMSDIAAGASVEVSTVGDWIAVLERTNLVMRLQPFHSNLNKRLIKSPKIHVIDAGLALHLQGWSEAGPAMLSPQISGIFESLVVGEVIRTRDHFLRDWQLFFWRTKEGEEVDLVVIGPNQHTVLIECKVAHDAVSDIPISPSLAKDFPAAKTIIVATSGGAERRISRTTWQVPITKLRDRLLAAFA